MSKMLMLVDRYDVNAAAHYVGYESPTQFIREYKTAIRRAAPQGCEQTT
jgi:AraC-like DNA-binding protein